MLSNELSRAARAVVGLIGLVMAGSSAAQAAAAGGLPASAPAAPAKAIPTSAEIREVGVGKGASPTVRAYIDLIDAARWQELKAKAAGAAGTSAGAAPAPPPSSFPLQTPSVTTVVERGAGREAGQPTGKSGRKAPSSASAASAPVAVGADQLRGRESAGFPFWVTWVRSVVVGGRERAELLVGQRGVTVSKGDLVEGWVVAEISAKGVWVERQGLGGGVSDRAKVTSAYDAAPPTVQQPSTVNGVPVAHQPNGGTPPLPPGLKPDSTALVPSAALPVR